MAEGVQSEAGGGTQNSGLRAGSNPIGALGPQGFGPYARFAQPIFDWIRSHVELSVVSSVLAAIVSFVGGRYYSAYYGFFLVDAGQFEVGFRPALLVSLAAGSLTLGMLYFIYSSAASRATTFGETLRGNLPLLVVLVFVAICMIDFYMRNVNVIVSYTTGHSLGGLKAEQIKQAEETVLRVLRRAMLLVPFPLAILVILWASWKRFSIAAVLTRGKLLWRAAFLLAYAVLFVVSIGIVGRTVAFLEFVHLLENPRIRIFFNDGSEYLPDRNLFLLAQDDRIWCVVARSQNNAGVKTWFISRAGVRAVELSEGGATVTEFMNYFR